jgi:hypothetical protein
MFGERHLRHLLRSYATYYNEARTHLSVNKDAPSRRTVHAVGRILPTPFLGGFHHLYVRVEFRQAQVLAVPVIACGLMGLINTTNRKMIRTRIVPGLGRRELSRRRAQLPLNASVFCKGPGQRLSDRHTAAVEAREREAVEGFAESSALVPQHADGHLLADRH